MDGVSDESDDRWEDEEERHFQVSDFDNGQWVGFADAADWILYRGHSVNESNDGPEDILSACRLLVNALLRIPPEEAEAQVWGIGNPPAPPYPAPIPAGIWLLVGISDAEIVELKDKMLRYPYTLSLIDYDESESTSRLYYQHTIAYHGIVIRTPFVLDNWPARAQISKTQIPLRRYSMKIIERWLEPVCRKVPSEISPLTVDEVMVLVLDKFAGAPRDPVRAIYRKISPDRRTGRRGIKKALRNQLFEEFRGKIHAAKTSK